MILPIKKVKNLYYKKGLSARKVAEILGVSVWQIIKFMKKNNLSRRTQAETRRLSFLAAPPSFKTKSTLTNKEKKLKIAGLMLYWGEGANSDDTVDLANSDPLMIKLFLKMLRELYGVKEERLRVLLYCYANQNVENLISYWLRITGIPQRQFIKPYVRLDFLEKKRNKMPCGLVHIRYNDKKLVAIIKNDLKKCLENLLSQGGGVAKRTSL